jgi:hypothetical protein
MFALTLDSDALSTELARIARTEIAEGEQCDGDPSDADGGVSVHDVAYWSSRKGAGGVVTADVIRTMAELVHEQKSMLDEQRACNLELVACTQKATELAVALEEKLAATVNRKRQRGDGASNDDDDDETTVDDGKGPLGQQPAKKRAKGVSRECDLCGKTVKYLNTHRYQNHRDVSYKCIKSGCSYQSKRKAGLQRHVSRMHAA